MKGLKRIGSIMLCLLLTASMFTACNKADTVKDKNATTVFTEAPADNSEINELKETTEPTEPTEPVEPTEAADEQLELTLGIWPAESNTDEVTLQEGYIEEFAKTHPNIKVVPAGYAYSADNFIQLAKSGDLPVIFETYFLDTQKLIESGYIADITDILSARGWIDKINPSMKELLSKDGRVYGIPSSCYGLGIMVNVELFKEAGLVDKDGIPIYPKTWTELAETGKKIKDATGAAGFCLLAMDDATGWQFSNIAWAFGAILTTENADGTFTSNLDSAEAIAAMEYVKSLRWEYDILTADPTVEDYNTGYTKIGTGEVAMYMGANDAVGLPTYHGLPVEDLGLFPMPAGPDGKQFTLSGGCPYMFCKEATDEQINAALDYITIMGKGPVIDKDSYEADCRYKVDNSIPVIPRFPCWIDPNDIDQETVLIKKYANADGRLYQDFFDTMKLNGNLHIEEYGNIQEMYHELTAVIQAVIKDKDSDVTALMKKADENYQHILDITTNDHQILDKAMKATN